MVITVDVLLSLKGYVFFVQTTSSCTSCNLHYLHHRISVDFWKSWTFQFLPGSASFPAIWSDMCCVFHLCQPHPSHIASAVSGLPQMSSSCRKTSGQSLSGWDFGEKNPHIKNHWTVTWTSDLIFLLIIIFTVYILDLKKKSWVTSPLFIHPPMTGLQLYRNLEGPESNGKKFRTKFRFQDGWREQFGGTKRTSSLVITSTQPGPHNLVWKLLGWFQEGFLVSIFFQG